MWNIYMTAHIDVLVMKFINMLPVFCNCGLKNCHLDRWTSHYSDPSSEGSALWSR